MRTPQTVSQMQSPIFVGRTYSHGLNSSKSEVYNNNNTSSQSTGIREDIMIGQGVAPQTLNSRYTSINSYNGMEEQSSRVVSPNLNGTTCGTTGMLPDVLINDESGGGRIRTLTLAKPMIEDINIGFNLTRSQWDPYPWVKCVDKDSCAEKAGLKEGDCLIKVGDEDLLGLKVSDVASLVRSQRREVPLLVWSAGVSKDGDSESLLLGPLPLALTRLSSCLASVLRAAECPVCARTIPAPAHQCPSGHLLCVTCRSRMEYCPLCRSALGRCRNLLADEVYNCVLENFDLRPDKRERLTKTLFGEDAKFIVNHGTTRSLGNFQETSRQAKWGTQKLLDRLLPGRARSTGNIARAGDRNRTLVEDDRDVSRSLSTLDIARCSTEVSPCHSLPSITVGSSDSINQNVRYTVDQNEISNRAARQESVIRYNCPVDSSCRGTIAGDVQSHIVLSHDIEVLLKPSEGQIKLCGHSTRSLISLLHRSGLWFYPKYFRDERKKGIKIWCWIVASSEISNKYHMNIEVHKTIADTKHNVDGINCEINKKHSISNESVKKEVIVSAVVHRTQEIKISQEVTNSSKISGDSIEEIAENDINVETRKYSRETDDGICILVENSPKEYSNITNGQNDICNVEGQIKEPILKFSAPVLSLVEIGWNDVLNNGTRSVFLSDCILSDNVEVIATIEEVN